MRYRMKVNFSLVKTVVQLGTCWAPSGLTFIPWVAQEPPQVLSALMRQRFHVRPLWEKVTCATKHVTNCHKSSPGQTSKVLKICFVKIDPHNFKLLSDMLGGGCGCPRNSSSFSMLQNWPPTQRRHFARITVSCFCSCRNGHTGQSTPSPSDFVLSISRDGSYKHWSGHRSPGQGEGQEEVMIINKF